MIIRSLKGWSSTIPHRNKLGIIVAFTFFFMSVLRLPAELQYSRGAIRIIMETGVLIALGFFIIQQGSIWIGLFTLLMVFSSFYPVVGKSSYFARNCIFYGLVWYTIVILIFSKDSVKYLMYAMCGIAFIHTVFLVWQHFGLDPYRTFTFGLMKTATITKPTGLMSMMNEASGLLALTAPAFLVNRRIMGGLILIVIGLLIAKSAGGIVAVGVGAIFFLSLSGFRLSLMVGCLGGAIIASLLYVSLCEMPSISSRWGIWVNGWKYYKLHWVLGWGLGHWKIVTKQLHAHNDIFQMLFEMGIGAGVLMVGYFSSIFRKFTRQALIPTTAMVIILVHSGYSFLWFIGTTAIVSVTWMAILEIQLNDRQL